MNLSIVIQQHIKPLIMVSYVELAMSYRLSSQQTTTSTIITYQIVKELPITRSELKPLNRSCIPIYQIDLVMSVYSFFHFIHVNHFGLG